jgi:hypothetical protein
MRAVAEASIVALAFGFIILLVGLPIAFSVRIVGEGISWLAGSSAATVVGGVIATAAVARALVGFFRWRRDLRRGTRSAGIGPAEAELA